MKSHTSSYLKEQARARAREILAQSASFKQLEKAEQFSLYKDIVEREYQKLAGQNGHAMASSQPTVQAMNENTKLISDTIGALTPQLNNAPGQFREMALGGGRSFVNFVKDLLNGVFDANLRANEQQMEAFAALLKDATRSLSSFVSEVGNADAKYYLAENFPNEFGIGSSGGGFGGGFDGFGSGFSTSGSDDNVKLLDQEGSPVDEEDDAIRAKLMDAKLAMAKERRALLRETLLMGVSRLVVTDGKISADLKLKLNNVAVTQSQAKANRYEQKRRNIRMGGGFLGFLTGGSGISISNTSGSGVAVNARGQETTNSTQEMKGHVEINFKSDYFELDNFADMYGKITREDRDEAGKEAQ